jgi:hypothetical protein
MLKFSDFIIEQDESLTHHASVIPLTGFSPISHMGHARDLGSAMKSLPGEKHVGISSKADLYSGDERSNILKKQWGQQNLKTHLVKSGGETIANAFHSLPKTGKKVLHILVGHDRKDFANGLKKSLDAGKIKEMGDHKWDEIHIHHPEDVNREHGMSGTNMRNAAHEGNLKVFHRHLGSSFSSAEAKEHMKKFQKGIASGAIAVKRPGSGSPTATKEQFTANHRAIFVTGGPGSGKDIIIREAIVEPRICEMNFSQAKNYLGDKHLLCQKTNDLRRESIRTRGPLIINGPADDSESIMHIKEELEELGYKTMMIFVETTNDASKERNSLLSRTMVESVRHDKWIRSHDNIVKFKTVFDNFILFENTESVNIIEDEINSVYEFTNAFLKSFIVNRIEENWFVKKLIEGYKNVKKDSKLIQQSNRKTKDQTAGCKCPKANDRMFKLNDNNCPYCQINRKSGTIDSVKDGDVASNGTYTFRTYAEQSQPTVKVNAMPKEPNFQQDKDKIQKMKNRGWKNSPSGALKASGVSPEFDTRQQGTVYPMSGMGDVTYREQKQFKKFREAIDSPGEVAMGVSGVLNGATNKEPMVTPMDKFGMSGITIKKKRKTKPNDEI